MSSLGLRRYSKNAVRTGVPDGTASGDSSHPPPHAAFAGPLLVEVGAVDSVWEKIYGPVASLRSLVSLQGLISLSRPGHASPCHARCPRPSGCGAMADSDSPKQAFPPTESE